LVIENLAQHNKPSSHLDKAVSAFLSQRKTPE